MRRKPRESGETNGSHEGKKSPLVGIVMGSDSDLPVMEEAERILEQFQVPYEVTLSSAHRSPDRTHRYTMSAEEKGLEVIIVGAGAAAHLAGVIAAKTTLPVIGVPIDSSPLKGMDSLLSTVQMPGGVPVATMAVGRAGARNAAILAVQILALKYPRLKGALKGYKKRLEKEVEEKAKRIRRESM
jgi:phosphoribosylaminoimidazole carboxylase PurE protein